MGLDELVGDRIVASPGQFNKYVKRPIVVEAIFWGGDKAELEQFMGYIPYIDASNCVKIQTLEGELSAKPGDYIIRGIRGELYPCRRDIFEKTYIPVMDY